MADTRTNPASSLKIQPTGESFLRPGGREGWWMRRAKIKEPDDHVTCPFDFVVVPGVEAEQARDILREARPADTPILFGSPHEAGLLLERMSIWPETTRDWLQKAENFDIDAWLAERADQVNEWEKKYSEVIPRRGPWPMKDMAWTNIRVPKDILTDEFHPTVVIGLLPTDDPTEVAAHLRFGGWNDCPLPPVHIALAKRWREKYGAVLVSHTYETLEFRVARPLQDREEAFRVALELFHYNREGVPDTIDSAACELIGSSVWSFWWD